MKTESTMTATEPAVARNGRPQKHSRVWVIRAGERSRLVDDFVTGDVTGVGYPAVPDGRSVTRDQVEEMLVDDGTPAAVKRSVAMFDAFVNDVGVGDAVLMPDTPRGDVLVGTVTSGYEYHAELPHDRFRHRRAVEWRARVPLAELPESEQGLQRQRTMLADLTSDDLRAFVGRVVAGDLGRPAVTPPGRYATPAPVGRVCTACGTRKADSVFDGSSAVCIDCE